MHIILIFLIIDLKSQEFGFQNFILIILGKSDRPLSNSSLTAIPFFLLISLFLSKDLLTGKTSVQNNFQNFRTTSYFPLLQNFSEYKMKSESKLITVISSKQLH